MKPDSFKSQLQTVLTAYYDDINGVQGASGCPKTSTRLSSASSRTKRRPEQRLTRTPPRDAAANAAAPTIPPHGSAASAAGRVEPPAAPITASSPAASPGGTGKGKRVAWGGRKNARS